METEQQNELVEKSEKTVLSANETLKETQHLVISDKEIQKFLETQHLATEKETQQLIQKDRQVTEKETEKLTETQQVEKEQITSDKESQKFLETQHLVTDSSLEKIIEKDTHEKTHIESKEWIEEVKEVKEITDTQQVRIDKETQSSVEKIETQTTETQQILETEQQNELVEKSEKTVLSANETLKETQHLVISEKESQQVMDTKEVLERDTGMDKQFSYIDFSELATINAGIRTSAQQIYAELVNQKQYMNAINTDHGHDNRLITEPSVDIEFENIDAISEYREISTDNSVTSNEDNRRSVNISNQFTIHQKENQDATELAALVAEMIQKQIDENSETYLIV